MAEKYDVSGDPYFKERESIPKNEEFLHLEEVNHQCPLCGKFLTSKGKRGHNKDYQIAHIFPQSPTKDDMAVLKDVERLGDNCESFENKIALCKDHHWDYDQNKTVEDYNHLVSIKKSLIEGSTVKRELSKIRIEAELAQVITGLVGITEEKMKGPLNMEALTVESKIEPQYMLLLNHVKYDVTTYYPTIKEMLKDECARQNKKFNTLCSQVKYIYEKCSDTMHDKESIYEGITQWLTSQTGCKEETCRVVASFFVQNCEIYEKFTE